MTSPHLPSPSSPLSGAALCLWLMEFKARRAGLLPLPDLDPTPGTSLVVSHFAAIEHRDRGHFRKKPFIPAHGFREMRIHHGREAWQRKQEAERSSPQPQAGSRKGKQEVGKALYLAAPSDRHPPASLQSVGGAPPQTTVVSCYRDRRKRDGFGDRSLSSIPVSTSLCTRNIAVAASCGHEEGVLPASLPPSALISGLCVCF